MNIIKLNATDSTNLYLKNLVLSGTPDDLTVVVADLQTKGRGQMGENWNSEYGKNLTFSVLKEIKNFNIKDQFQLNICVSLAIFDALNALKIPDLKIKWPNDILSGTSKICGILIENIIKGTEIRVSIIGVGLNVNQTDFPNLFNASSLKLLLEKMFILDDVLERLLLNIKDRLGQLESDGIISMTKSYQKVLFRKDQPSVFRNKDGKLFNGIITGVSKIGKLQVLTETNGLKEFDLKQIKLLY